MTQVWVVRYDEGLYLFKDAATAEQSIKDMYKGEDVEFDKVDASDVAFMMVIGKNGHVQDQVQAVEFDVHESPTVIHRYVTEIDTPQPRPKREEF